MYIEQVREEMYLEVTYANQAELESMLLHSVGNGSFQGVSCSRRHRFRSNFAHREQGQRNGDSTLHLCIDTIAWGAQPTRHKLIHNLFLKVKKYHL